MFSFQIRTIVLVIVFSQYMRSVQCPFPTYKRDQGWALKKLDIFTLLPVNLIYYCTAFDHRFQWCFFICLFFYGQVLLSIVIVWSLCAILTVGEALEVGNPARTDNKINILLEAPWFRFPYPCNNRQISFYNYNSVLIPHCFCRRSMGFTDGQCGGCVWNAGRCFSLCYWKHRGLLRLRQIGWYEK